MKKLYTIILFVLVGAIANAQYTKLLDFTGINGNQPYGSLISDGTFLYGMTSRGGINDIGVILKIMPDGTGYSDMLDFTGSANGNQPGGSLISDGVFLYGMTKDGGANNFGVIFKIKPDGTGYSKLYDFGSAANDGAWPNSSLISDGTFLYGMTTFGGASINGTIFKIKSDGTGYSKLYDFGSLANDGNHPRGDLISDGTFLYGMTQQGGANGDGIIFKIKSDGTGYTNLFDFAGSLNGKQPGGSFISDGTFLYGMTYLGGTNDSGVIFKIKPDGTGYTKLIDFAGSINGSYPDGSLVSDGTFLYGTTKLGGLNNMGTVFKIKPDGTGYSDMLDFAGSSNGSNPLSNLISDGAFLYGMTPNGGSNNLGTVFKLGVNTGVTENNVKNGFTIYPNPFSVQTVLKTGYLLHNTTLTVFNCFGQTVKQIMNISGESIIFNRENLPSGLYFVRLGEENKIVAIDKLVIVDK